jgi:hypothetical protein
MPIESWQITGREEWLERRRQDITGSVAAALLGVHERITPLQLYLDKAGVVSLDNGDTPAMRRGRLLEPLALTLIKEAHPDWQAVPAQDYIRDPVHRLGVTPDVYVHDAYGRFGVVEVKSVEPGVFQRTWCRDGTIQPTMASAVQATLARHLAGAEFAMVGVLRVGMAVDFDLIEVPRTPGLIERLEAAADDFWRSVELQQPPAPNFPADTDLVLQIAKGADTGETLELPDGDNYLPALLAEYVEKRSAVLEAEKRCKTIKAEVLHRMGPATTLTQSGRVLATAKTRHCKAEAKPRPAYSFRDFRIPVGALEP